jgi:hypothetical protein
MRKLTTLSLALVLVAGAAVAQQAPPPQRLRGSIDAIDGQMLMLKSREGQMIHINVTDNTPLVGVVKASLADVKKDKFVGVASMPQADGTQKALEVLIFPDAMRGSNEGHYPWDLQPQSMMTNANVEQTVEKVDGPVLTLKYKDGEKTVIVPKDAPIVTFDKAERSDLKPGAHVMVVAAKQPDGMYTANRILVGKNGVVPPM